MTSALAPLVGRYVTVADVVHDYIQLRFDNGDILNIFNEYGLEGIGGFDVQALVGRRVASVSVQPQEVRVQLDGVQLRVSLLDAAFRGPEAIEYIPASGCPVVWS